MRCGLHAAPAPVTMPIPGICAISGHSERAAGDILKHYLDLTGEMADAAIKKLVEYEKASVGNAAAASDY